MKFADDAADDGRAGLIPYRRSTDAGVSRAIVKRFLVLAFIVLGIVAGRRAAPRARAPTSIPLVEGPARAGSPFDVALKVSVPEGLHTQSNKPRDKSLIPTTLTIDAPRAYRRRDRLASVDRYGAGRRDKPLAVFEREFLIGARLLLPASRSFTGDLTYRRSSAIRRATPTCAIPPQPLMSHGSSTRCRSRDRNTRSGLRT